VARDGILLLLAEFHAPYSLENGGVAGA
jgi:hypothetical protein